LSPSLLIFLFFSPEHFRDKFCVDKLPLDAPGSRHNCFSVNSVAWRLAVGYTVINSSLVDDPTVRSPDFHLIRLQRLLLNRFRTGQGHCGTCRQKCVSAATSRQCHTSLIPARWLNSTVVYNVDSGWRKNCRWLADVIRHIHGGPKTDTQVYLWDNFGNAAPILTILSLLQAEIYGA